MKYPLVSVVVPTYNQPALLEQALASVFAQTFTDYEVVVVNDGSTDDTAQRLEAYGDRIRLINQANKGIGVARNRGLDEARGRFIATLDHDDIWRPEKLAVQVKFMQDHPCCVAAFSPYARSTSPSSSAFDVDVVCDGHSMVKQPALWISKHYYFAMSSTMIVESSVAKKIRYDPTIGAYEDYPFYIKLFSIGNIGITGNKILAIYRVHSSNSSSSPSHHFNGIRLLRHLQANREFISSKYQSDEDVEILLASVARGAIAAQLFYGAQWNGLRLYFSEFGAQVRQQRWRFLLAFLIGLLLPGKIVKKFWARVSQLSSSIAWKV